MWKVQRIRFGTPIEAPASVVWETMLGAESDSRWISSTCSNGCVRKEVPPS